MGKVPETEIAQGLMSQEDACHDKRLLLLPVAVIVWCAVPITLQSCGNSWIVLEPKNPIHKSYTSVFAGP
jgi:hypothetical protein